MSTSIEIYTKFGCPYCSRARQLLSGKGVSFAEHDITMGGPRRLEMEQRAPNARTVPQIFIGENYVGGCDNLYAMDANGKLDLMLAELSE